MGYIFLLICLLGKNQDSYSFSYDSLGFIKKFKSKEILALECFILAYNLGIG